MNANLLISIFIFLFSALSSFAQNLKGTQWSVYDPSGIFVAYFYFGTDSLYYNPDGISYTPGSLYVENGNIMTIADLPGFSCSVIGGVVRFIPDTTGGKNRDEC